MRGQRRERHTSTNAHPLLWRSTDAMQCWNGPQPDQNLRRKLAPFHVRVKIGTTRDQHGLFTFLRQHLCSFIEATRSQVAKWRKSQHQDIPPSASMEPRPSVEPVGT